MRLEVGVCVCVCVCVCVNDTLALHEFEETFISRIQKIDGANRMCVFVLLCFIQDTASDKHAHHSD